MRYFLDTEFNGFGGALLSLALVPEDRGEELYLTLDWTPPLHPWVERHVLPYLDTVPVSLQGPRLSRDDAAKAVSFYLQADPKAEIIADWPEDIAQFCTLLMTGPGLMVRVPALTFRLLPLPGFSPAGNSAVPHNALHDARALRDHLQELLD
jgi:hypothetical protein